jgi:hypothetical protein
MTFGSALASVSTLGVIVGNFLATVSTVGLVAVATAALADEPTSLNQVQMDQITAGEARSAIEVAGSSAIGPSKAVVSASGLAVGSTSASVTTTIEASLTSTPGSLVGVASSNSSALAR